ncbi:MAG: biotin synthase BioB, partial [Thermodesulfobacteriota bacterium]
MAVRKTRSRKNLEAGPGSAELEALFDPLRTPTWDLIERARHIRRKNFGNRAHLCNILNAKSGACTEDCAFCSQSVHHRSSASVYPLVTVREALGAAREAESFGARCFSLVTSGRSLKGRRERQRLLRIVETIRARTGLEVACSIGLETPDFLRDLRAAGLNTFHHNLETAASHYDMVCTTHGYQERMQTVRAAKQAGFTLCSGGIFGMGESPAQRAELALTLRQLGVDRIPVNFLNPLPGTAMEGRSRLEPLEALHIVAALRVALPKQDILVCGGREVTLRSLQPLLFNAGANGIMTGKYLTTPG